MLPSEKLADMPEALYVRKAFKLDRLYAVGEKFDTTTLPVRRVRQMWNQRKLGTQSELDKDASRYAARCDAETAAKRSANPIPPEIVLEGQTAEDLGL